MTQSFDDFHEENKDVFDPCVWRSAEKAFQAGAQSKQAEIDELRNMVKKLIDNTVIGIDDDVENKARDLLKGTNNE